MGGRTVEVNDDRFESRRSDSGKRRLTLFCAVLGMEYEELRMLWIARSRVKHEGNHHIHGSSPLIDKLRTTS